MLRTWQRPASPVAGMLTRGWPRELFHSAVRATTLPPTAFCGPNGHEKSRTGIADEVYMQASASGASSNQGHGHRRHHAPR